MSRPLYIAGVAHSRTMRRKAITGCLVRAIEREPKIIRATSSMSWPEYERLLEWLREWQRYLRHEREHMEVT
jgi:hypothetical protein